MTVNENLKRINQEARQENEKEKLCLIEDIFKVKRMLFGFGHPDHQDTISHAGDIFTALFDMPIGDLENIYTLLSSEMSKTALNLADQYR